MTPPDTNRTTQERRHRGPLIGMAIAVLIGFGVIIYWVFEEFAQAPGPDTEEFEVNPAEDAVENDEIIPGGPVEDLEPGDPDVEMEP